MSERFTFTGANSKNYQMKRFDEMNAGEQEGLMILTSQLTEISMKHVDRQDIADAVNAPNFDPANFEMTPDEINELMPMLISVSSVMRKAFIGSDREYDRAVNSLGSIQDKYEIFIKWLMSEQHEKK